MLPAQNSNMYVFRVYIASLVWQVLTYMRRTYITATIVFELFGSTSIASSSNILCVAYFGNDILWHLYSFNLIWQILPEMRRTYTTATIYFESAFSNQRPIISRHIL